MSLKIVVLAKQVPDTRNVGKDAMNADGTINRAALPAIFNPEDLNALEQALRLKDTHPGSTVTILTMGPGRAAEIIREGLYRGADNGYLLTDRAFAGADTLATSYAIATAIRKIGECDLIIGGRQAIDGDTAQVGPQVAEKLGLSQITYTEEILNVDETARRITVKRHIDGGVETVEGPLPIVLTVNGSAAPCRPRNAKLLQKYKRALGAQEKAAITKDLNALEQALRLKDTHPGSTVTILTMGPGRAAEIIREGLYRGADNGYLLTDRAFAGADTLATSYAIATAIRKIGECDLIIGGRQAIDGDTAQVGPQVAEKLGLSQITYTEEILNVDETARRITVKRHIDGGVETVEGPLPIVLTVNGSAAPCRPRNAKLLQKYKRALGAQEKAAITKDGSELPYAELYEKFPYLNITEWSVADVEGDTKQCGLSGSPTKVKKIENIVFQAKESKTMTGSDQDVEGLIVELLANHTIG